MCLTASPQGIRSEGRIEVVDILEADDEPRLDVSVDFTTSLRRWWIARQKLYNAKARLSRMEVQHTVSQLNRERDNVREAYERTYLTASSREELDEKVLYQMGTFGAAGSVLHCLLEPIRDHLLRTTYVPACTVCSELQREPTSFSQLPPRIFVQPSSIRAADGDVFAALLSKCNHILTQPVASTCAYCGAHEPLDDVPMTSVRDCGAPALIAVELDDKAPSSMQELYYLRANEDHVLSIDSIKYGTYRLAAVIYYKLNTHFITDVFDERERSWIRSAICSSMLHHGRALTLQAQAL